MVSIASFFGNMDSLQVSITDMTKKEILREVKKQHPEKDRFLPHKAAGKCSHFNKSVQTTRNLFMGPLPHLADKNLLEM